MISLDRVFELYAQNLRPLAGTRKPLAQALGAVLTEPVNANVDLPMFTQSSVDGYALRSGELAAASETAPVILKLVGEVAAGAPASFALAPGCAVRIFTGGVIPEGADTAARQEIVERSGDEIRLRQPLAAGTDLRFRGEELRAGEPLASGGQRLTSGLLAALAMAGIGAVSVRPRPRVALLVSGDEVVAGDREPRAGEIFDANGPLASAWLAERGYPLVSIQRIPDDPELLRAAMSNALANCELLISTGGVSVGDRDYIPALARELGVRKVFWKVAQKPGKPLWFGIGTQGKPFLGMPGNPAAVFACLHLHAARVLSLIEGETPEQPAWHTGVLAHEIRNDAQRDQLVRVAVSSSAEDGSAQLLPLPRQDSHMLSNLGQATGIAWVRRGAGPVPRGARVQWIPAQARRW